MSTALLLAEPQPETRGFLERHLTSDGFQVVDEGARPDLVLLGDTAALDACRARHGDVPVIVLGEPESDTVDRVRALDRGCDDFLAKPFDYEELLARIRAVLRRTTPPAHETLRAGPITADLATRCVTVDGVPVALAGKEYELLLKLMTDPTRVFTKEQLLREVWDFRSLGSELPSFPGRRRLDGGRGMVPSGHQTGLRRGRPPRPRLKTRRKPEEVRRNLPRSIARASHAFRPWGETI